MQMGKKKQRIKKIYIRPKEEDEKKVISNYKKDVNELEEDRKKTGSGFRGFLRKASINYKINQKRKFISDTESLKHQKLKNKLAREKLESDKIKNQIRKERSEMAVNFKPISMSDLYNT